MKIEGQLEVAKNVAEKAGDFLIEHFGKEQKIIREKEKDFTTEVDRLAEKIIIGEIQRSFPDDSILSEEIGKIKGVSHHLWVIDPLDGTVNYAHGFPYFCLIISLFDLLKNETVLGIIHNPTSKKTVFALRGKGAFLNGKKISVSGINKLEESFLTLGHFDPNKKEKVQILGAKNRSTIQKEAFKYFLRVRELGSIGLDMANVAMGVTEAHLSFGKPWDLLGPALIVCEAGGKVVDFYGNEVNMESTGVLASNNVIYQEVVSLFIGKQ